VAVVTADRDYYERVMALGGEDADEINFPPYAPDRRIPLTVDTVRIGRHSVSTGDVPEIDLRQAPPDPGVSQLHAVLMCDQDGTWTVVDVGSTNGTTVNDGSEPLEANTPVPLAAGDRVHVGAWTTITMEAP
jgi:pSer/pThr/pTyr-binding forkhead associated (FHA) protein